VNKKAKEVADDREARVRVQNREARERSPAWSEKSLTSSERVTVAEHSNLSASTLYCAVSREDKEKLRRSVASLWWSGAAVETGISLSVLAQGVIHTNLGSGHSYLTLLESLGYTFGFVLVILSLFKALSW